MVLYCIMVIVGVALLLWFIYEKCLAYTLKATLVKIGCSACFFIVGTVSTYQLFQSNNYTLGAPFTLYLVNALLFCLLGDIFLDLKYVYRKDETAYTFAGFLVFAIAHGIMGVGIIWTFMFFVEPLWFIVPVVVGMLLGVVNANLGKVMKLDYGKYKGITAFYGGILLSMTLLMLSLNLRTGFENPFLIGLLVGYVLFLISDLILSQTYFAGKEGRFYIASNYACYYVAMFILASTPLLLV